ncbi:MULTISPECIES: OmpH family outer membrane protein [Chryseobacterium]|jgi:outer membrane protein|uniref:OmpH family outer membrane protein n=1 Tax=Chryseobacterium gambrini TaxID=373672 RepID=A0ABM8K2N1_9FLAO|nr:MULTISPECIES: OmpH family outer membrane protein [Chryseobacterium]MBL7878681.1 OmpH family outer membrane protein [Chryseobacterium gambrini]MCQ4138315.1 OmpH family outer membrane protein [Chryseobacterium sp. EO14]MCY1661953.1 OmpH family outer membrane protein [Chryseobacterium sp. SL1]WBV53223.1 OmpH family outer membrane protein [Chryseobacterium gambrini]BEV03160.1 OmpH family outer membrane protein [Chryseobacterium gambrini]
MKKFITTFSIAAGLFLTSNMVSAQQKIGHVNSDDIFTNLPEAKTAEGSLDTFTKTKQGEIEKMITSYQTKLKAAQDKEKTISEANKETVIKELTAAQTELQTLGKDIETSRTKAAQEISKKQTELFTPIQKKVSAMIATVAKEKGLAYVFDIAPSQGNSQVAYMDGGEDITPTVKSKLGATGTASKPASK